MTSRRIEMEQAGSVSAAGPKEPQITSNDSPWSGLLLERHLMPAGALPEGFFLQHLVLVEHQQKPYRLFWSEDGRRHVVSIGAGTVGVRSAQLLRDHGWTGSRDFTALSISPTFLEAVTEQSGLEFAPSMVSSDPRVAATMAALEEDVRAGYPHGAAFGEHVATALCVHLAGTYGTRHRSVRQPPGTLHAAAFRRVLEHIDQHLADSLQLTGLAASVGLSPYHFAKLFTRTTGKPPHVFITDQRIAAARRLLELKSHRISEIASEVGMPNQSHFARLFRLRMGVTPSSYRSQHRR